MSPNVAESWTRRNAALMVVNLALVLASFRLLKIIGQFYGPGAPGATPGLNRPLLSLVLAQPPIVFALLLFISLAVLIGKEFQRPRQDTLVLHICWLIANSLLLLYLVAIRWGFAQA